jgi:uncharacterized repeat protein (TIGR01451 family)
MDVFCYVAGVCQATPAASLVYTSTSAYVPSGLPGPICRVRWTYTGTLTPGNYIYNNINVCVRSNRYDPPFAPVLAGQSIVNNVCATGLNVPPGTCTSSNDIVTATAPNILAGKFFAGKSGTCLPGCSPDMTGPFYPGDVVRWRMAIANVGSATATPCTITDLLPAGFEYVGNPTYYYGPLFWSTSTNPSCCAMSATPPAIIGGITSPSPGATSLTWTFPTLPANCNGNVDYLVIEFDVKADDNPTIPPGNYFNTFTFSAGNLPLPVTSNPAQVTINGYAAAQIYKDVRPNLPGTSFSSTAGVQAGSQAEFRLRIQNTGILTLSNLYLLDIMPHIGDVRVLPPYTPRGSGYDLQLTTAVTPVTGYQEGYNSAGSTKNPTRPPLFCGVLTSPPGDVLGSFGTLFTPTYSFQYTGLPATMLAPGGTQDFFFTATVPPGTPVGANACNSFAFQATAYGTTICLNTESSPACVDVIPPDKDECDSVWGEPEFTECCSFSTTISNTLGSLVSLQYNVLPVGGGASPSGVVQDVTTSPCSPSSTIPGSLAGTTSGTLNYSPPCGGPMTVDFETASTMATGEICIELIATFVGANGVQVVCIDTVCYRCDPAPQDRCDSLAVRPRADKQFSIRSFTIHNLKSPSSPICSVEIAMVPPPPASALIGGGLVVDGTPQPWTAANSSGFTEISGINGLPGNSTITFFLGVNYAIGWVGDVTITVIHCDGTTCTVEYKHWDATKGGTIVIGTPIDVPDRATLHMHSLQFSRDEAEANDARIRSIAINYSDPATEVVAVTGATYPCEPDAVGVGECDDIFEEVRVDDKAVLIELRRDLDDQRNLTDPIVTVVYRADNDEPVPVEIIYYDEHGQEIGHEDLEITGEEPPGQIVSGLTGDQSMAMMLGALTARPNPTSGRCDLGFTLPSASKVELELLDMRGARVATVISGEHLTAGEHHRMLDMETIPSGSYLVSLRVNGVPSVLRIELTK